MRAHSDLSVFTPHYTFILQCSEGETLIFLSSDSILSERQKKSQKESILSRRLCELKSQESIKAKKKNILSKNLKVGGLFASAASQHKCLLEAGAQIRSLELKLTGAITQVVVNLSWFPWLISKWELMMADATVRCAGTPELLRSTHSLRLIWHRISLISVLSNSIKAWHGSRLSP